MQSPGISDSSKESFSAGAMVLLGPLGHFGVRLGQKKWSGFGVPKKTAEMPGISKINVIEDDCYLFSGGGCKDGHVFKTPFTGVGFSRTGSIGGNGSLY